MHDILQFPIVTRSECEVPTAEALSVGRGTLYALLLSIPLWFGIIGVGIWVWRWLCQ